MAAGLDLRTAMRLAKRRLKALVGLDVWQRPEVAVPTVRLGTAGGRWAIASAGLGPGTIVYTCGVGTDVSFERDLIARFGTIVHAFDPTPLSIEWAGCQQFPDGFTFYPYGVADYDGSARFAPPRKLKFASFSMVRGGGVGSAIEAPVRRLATLRASLGLAAPDVLKLDIEGSEYAVLRDLLAGDLRPAQILVEFHHRWREVGARQTREAIDRLRGAGYRAAEVAPNGLEFTFVRAGGTASHAR